MQGSRSLFLLSLGVVLLAACSRPDAARPDHGTADGSNLYPITVDDRWGFIDASGDVVIEPAFDRAWSFTDGLALVQQGDRFGFIHTDGRFAVEPRFRDALFFSEGLAPVQIDDGNWGYIDRQGEFVVEPRFQLDPATIERDGSHFEPGPVPTHSNGMYGFREQNGEESIEARFDNAWYFSDGLARARVDEHWGYIDTEGEWVIEPRFDRAWDFANGLAMVEIDGRTGYVNRDGEYVWEPSR